LRQKKITSRHMSHYSIEENKCLNRLRKAIYPPSKHCYVYAPKKYTYAMIYTQHTAGRKPAPVSQARTQVIVCYNFLPSICTTARRSMYIYKTPYMFRKETIKMEKRPEMLWHPVSAKQEYI